MTQKKQNENSQQQTRGKILRISLGEIFKNNFKNPDDRAFSDMNRIYDISRNKQ